MIPKAIVQKITLSDGREITIETGKLAKQAHGSVVVRMGNTMLLATVVSNEKAAENPSFFPLSVDYQEKFAAAGRIPGGFNKREGKLSDQEILISRLVDRAMRPLFPDDYYNDTQINVFLISHDSEVMPDALAGLAASAAVMVSNIPFNGPMAEVRVAKVDGKLIINPTPEQMAKSTLDMMVGASEKDIVMVEGEMMEISEQEMLEALKLAHQEIRLLCAAQKELEAKAGKTEKRTVTFKADKELEEKIWKEYYPKMYEAARLLQDNKDLRKKSFKAVEEEFYNSLPEDHTIDLYLADKYLHDIQKAAARNLALDEKVRLDGRKADEIRPIWCEVDYLPMAHGSAVFTRGETQSLTTVTLGTKLDEKMIDLTTQQGFERFILHYNFPSFSTGEIKPNRGPGRREIGHGNLAQRGLKMVLPPESENPYVVRVVSDILESNGSSSMATVCAGTLALMDAGVQIKAPVAGIAMGMISDSKTGKYIVLSDILGDEDHLGDMDFKVVGTENGITACQMDIKVDGLSFEVLAQALDQARQGRLHILGIMKQAIEKPKTEMKPHAPRIEVIRIEKDQIGSVIGPGGKVIQEIQKDSGATIVIEEKEDGGYVNIFATNGDSLEKAKRRVKGIVAVPEIGEIYTGKVKNIQPFGAFVEFMPNKDGLLHISEIKWERLEKMDGVLEIGEEVTVKLIEVDKKTGKYKLSRKALLPKPEKKEQPTENKTENKQA
ncbi:MAG: polyribonucleotide nucleotidyltransferase [Raineya sp.]|jgi:polyribonucleotide nucleotidyltransferase|nr:polyribonucleotide nucleotidyltransferase [Raineya sp.]